METSIPPPQEPKEVKYCPNCSFPFEYCFYSGKYNEKCKKNLEEICPEILEEFKKQELNSTTKSIDNTNDTAPTSDGVENKKKVNINTKPQQQTKNATTLGEIIVSTKDRNRRKSITLVQNIESVGLNPKEIAKAFSKIFATSASATDDGITLNGNLCNEIVSFLCDKYSKHCTKDKFYTIKDSVKVPYF